MLNLNANRSIRSISKYLTMATIGFKHEKSSLISLLARSTFLLMTLEIFTQIWNFTSSKYLMGDMSFQSLVWYLVMTEWVMISTPQIHLQIERDFRQGEISNHLSRPGSYIWMKFAEYFGMMIWRYLYLGATGVSFAVITLGGLPSNKLYLFIPILVFLGSVLNLLFQIGMGVLVFWLRDTTPVFWLWQKSTFVLGGLTIPLIFYPDGLRSFAEWSPFSVFLFWPAYSTVHLGLSDVLISMMRILFWGGFTVWAVHGLFLLGVRTLQRRGE